MTIPLSYYAHIVAKTYRVHDYNEFGSAKQRLEEVDRNQVQN